MMSRKKRVKVANALAGAFGAVLMIGSVGEIDQGGDFMNFMARAFIGLAILSVSVAVHVFIEGREQECVKSADILIVRRDARTHRTTNR